MDVESLSTLTTLETKLMADLQAVGDNLIGKFGDEAAEVVNTALAGARGVIQPVLLRLDAALARIDALEPSVQSVAASASSIAESIAALQKLISRLGGPPAP